MHLAIEHKLSHTVRGYQVLRNACRSLRGGALQLPRPIKGRCMTIKHIHSYTTKPLRNVATSQCGGGTSWTLAKYVSFVEGLIPKPRRPAEDMDT